MFRIHNISYDEQLLNLCALLEHNPAHDYVSLPSNKDAATVLLSISTNLTQAPDEEDKISVGNYYVTLITEGKLNTWYIAKCEGQILDGTYEMAHLTQVQKGSKLIWKHPLRLDKVNLRKESIVECSVDGEWDVSQERNMTFTLRNHVFISNLVQEIFT